MLSRILAGIACACLLGTVPAPSPSPSPSAPPDPCGSILSIVNRPTVTTGVCTVRTGHFDVETGYTNTTASGAGGGSSVTYPQALLRFGTANPHLDLELSPPSYNRSSAGEPRIAGSSDTGIGMKYVAGYSANASWGTNVAITFPTGTHAFSAGNAQYTGNLNWSYALSGEFGLAGTMSFNALSGYAPSGRPSLYFAFIPSAELTAALPGGPSQIATEFAYFSQSGVGLGSKILVDFVYQRDLGPHVQLDVEYGFSPTLLEGQRQHYAGAGLSFMN